MRYRITNVHTGATESPESVYSSNVSFSSLYARWRRTIKHPEQILKPGTTVVACIYFINMFCFFFRAEWRCWSPARGRRPAPTTAACLTRSQSLLPSSSQESCAATAQVRGCAKGKFFNSPMSCFCLLVGFCLWLYFRYIYIYNIKYIYFIMLHPHSK